MRRPIFWFIYLLLVIVQLLLNNYLRISPYLMISILPVMVLCISIRVGTVGSMLIAFATGLVVDLLSEGLLGLNVAALVPVAFFRNGIIRLVFGTELFARNEDFSVQRNGFGKTALAVLIAQALFLLIYVWIDSAGMRPLSFDALRFAVSLVAGMLVSLLTLGLLAPDPRR